MWRDGKLVRVDRDGALPGRCVACNEPAAAHVSRTLYWSPRAWRYSFLLPFALLFGGVAFRVPVLTLAFWPALLLLAFIHVIVRKKLVLPLGVCERHRWQRRMLRALSIASVVGLLLVLYSSITLLAIFIPTVMVLAVVQSFVGVQAVSLKKLDAEHAWLGGTGRSFREALPEVPTG